jgi:cell division transport system permease protein
MFRRSLDLKLGRDGAGRYLAGTIGLMVYLAALALAASLAVGGAAERWDRALAGTATVQVPPDAAARLPMLLQALRAAPGVRRAEPLSPDAAAALLEPWLGEGVRSAGLPLPRLVDVRIEPGASIDALRRIAVEAAPGAVLDDHRRWVEPLLGFAAAANLAAFAVLALVAVASVMTVVFTTRAGLAVHHGVIEVLHLIGAQDGYIARQFERQALSLGLRGGIAGLVLAALTLGALAYAGRDAIAAGLVPLETADWRRAALVLALPLAAALVAMATARWTVLRALARLP